MYRLYKVQKYCCFTLHLPVLSVSVINAMCRVIHDKNARRREKGLKDVKQDAFKNRSSKEVVLNINTGFFFAARSSTNPITV